ncbi:TrmB family transcriptional regulator [Domibacillus robiginosus]|uniref:TrmB family transcriptional regulator n=1 Tax=Domibacillus robiginosus TaxID=1071054 RepID=UPI00067D84D6|nr:TrmB family transcriptional regulator [Domibacillus robiginosus]
MNGMIEKIQEMGFNQYESQAYVTLVKCGTSTAYQVSKESGIPRARVYDVLKSLAARGVVIQEKSGKSTLYSPLPVDVFLASIQSKWEATFSSVGESLKALEIVQPEPDKRVASIHGEEPILAFCETMLQKAERKVILSMWSGMYKMLQPLLKKAAHRCKMKGIVFQVEQPIRGLDVHRQTSFVEEIGQDKWFILSIDGKEMLYGPSVEQRATAFYTDDPVHIYLLENYVWHDILVNRLVKEKEMEKWISAERESFFK